MPTDIQRMDKQQGPMYSSENYTQYPGMNHSGKEYEKEYVCISLNHFALQQNLAQHCKSTILQFFKKRENG